MIIINNSIICVNNMIMMMNYQAEGLTAIECWVIACIIFVFGALLEYTVILLKLKLKKVFQFSIFYYQQTRNIWCMCGQNYRPFLCITYQVIQSLRFKWRSPDIFQSYMLCSFCPLRLKNIVRFKLHFVTAIITHLSLVLIC